MTRLWDELEGVYLAGEYGLERFLGSERGGAFFRTAFGPRRQPAAVKLVPEAESGGEDQLALWRRVAALSHPNLLALLDCGRAEAAGESFLYALYELPDDSLASAVANGRLSEPEIDELRSAAQEALRYIHQHDMVHTAVDPDHIVAVGDRIKLASDTLRAAGGAGLTPADDERALAALDYELRTGEKFVPPPEVILEPMAAGLAEAAPEPLRESEPVLERPPAPVAAALISPAPEPHRNGHGPKAPAEEPAAPAPARGGIPDLALALPKRAPALPLLVAAIGAVAIAVVLAMTQRGTPEAPWTAVAPVAAHQPVPSNAASPAPAPPVAESAPVNPAPAAPAPARATPARPREGWRVIAYTYNHRDHAEHKAQTINRQKPGFHAAVFAPRGAQPPFFVALGGRMSRQEAAALQKKARARGLPRDTFVRNFSE